MSHGPTRNAGLPQSEQFRLGTINPNHGQKSAERMSKLTIVGWTMSAVGTALWLYGYFTPGNPTLIAWQANTPWWIADFLPNLESEIGMVLVFASMVPIYWSPRSNNDR